MSIINRRQFTIASAATIAAASTLKNVHSAPNDTLGVAIVGCGGRGGSHLNAFLGIGNTEIRFLVDADEDAGERRAKQVAERQGRKPQVVTDMQIAFDSDDIDIVSTATPNHWHALCGIWAMQAGKDVYIEKPICHNISEGRSLIAAAKKYARICQVGTQCRSHAAIRNAMQFLHEGGIGDLKFARGLCYKRRKSIGPKGNYAIPSTVDFNMWSGRQRTQTRR